MKLAPVAKAPGTHHLVVGSKHGPLGGVGVEADGVLPGGVGGEGEAALRAVHLGQDDLGVGVLDLHVHADVGAGWHEVVGVLVIQLGLVISCK